MTHPLSIPILVTLLLTFVSCSGQDPTQPPTGTPAEELGSDPSKKEEPHQYGGWYCPDNFGFVPVDVQKLKEIPAIAYRLPTEQELHDNMSLIKVDTVQYPDARALDMELPRVARIHTDHKGMDELIIVIQAIVIQEDTVVGYRFANGGNGSAWFSDVVFLSENEVASMGSQPFFYSKSVLNASTEDIWGAIGKTDYFKQLGEKFDKQKFFSSAWNSATEVHLSLDTDSEKATGFVGMVYGNYYLQIDYVRAGTPYSEKLLMVEDHDNHTTELFFASGPYPKGFKEQKSKWDSWVEVVKKASEGG